MSNLGNGEKAEMLKTRADVNLTLLPDFLFRGFQWDFNALCFWRAVALRRLKPRGPDQGTRAHAPEAEHFLQNDLSQMPTVPPEEGLPETPFQRPTPECSSSLNFATGTLPSVCLGHGPLSHGLRPQLGLLGGGGTLLWVMPSGWGGLSSRSGPGVRGVQGPGACVTLDGRNFGGGKQEDTC